MNENVKKLNVNECKYEQACKGQDQPTGVESSEDFRRPLVDLQSSGGILCTHLL